jgi:RHS repeat-associated protein
LTTEQFQYDANNNVTQKTTRSGQTIGLSYDVLNRVQTKTPQGEAAGTVTYGYDYSGRMLQALDGSNSTPYQIGYDTAGRANSFTDQLGRSTQMAYDGVGNRTQVVWPAGTSGTGSYSVTYKYDAMNRMQYVNEGGTNNLLAQYSWDALSRARSIAYGDGTSDAYSQYDAGDNLRMLTQTYNGSNSSVTFNYTWLMNHQLNSAGVNNPLFQYVPQAGTVSYGAADVNNGLTTESASSVSATMTYDGNQNLTYDGYNTLTYDVENRMVQAENAAWGASTYLYGPLGERKEKSVAGVATDFVLAGGEEIADYYETSATWRLTVRGAGGLPLVTVVPAAGGGSEEIVYVHHDMKGSTVALTVPGGSGPAETYTYSDNGQPQSGTWLAYQYAGYRYDGETGLYYMPARYYSPALGRFLQSDPVGFRGGANLYAYAGNDPVNLVDPTGLTPDGGGGVTANASATINTSFMGVLGVPQVTVTATAQQLGPQITITPIMYEPDVIRTPKGRYVLSANVAFMASCTGSDVCNNLNFIQTVTTSYSGSYWQANVPFTDSLPANNNSPFYYTAVQAQSFQDNNPMGSTILFQDSPRALLMNGGPASFDATLYLVSVGPGNSVEILHTITWGFTFDGTTMTMNQTTGVNQ